MILMLNPEEPVVVHLETSCTEEEAVEKLLGWRQGPIRRQHTLVTEHGVPEEVLQYSHSLGGSLKQQLEDILEKARMDLVEAAEADAPIEVLQQLDDAVVQKKALVFQAQDYLLDIKEELNEEGDSLLRVDKKATADTGITHITLKSLDRWAQQVYGRSVLDPTVSKPVGKKSASLATEDKTDKGATKGGLGKTKADNLYTSFAFLVEALAKSAPGYREGEGESERPNVLAIATRISELARKANGGETLGGQSSEAIMDRVEAAVKVKVSKLPIKQPL